VRAAVVVLNGIRITTYQLIGLRMCRRNEIILDKQWWLVSNMAVVLWMGIGCIIKEEILHGNSGWINVAWERDQ